MLFRSVIASPTWWIPCACSLAAVEISATSPSAAPTFCTISWSDSPTFSQLTLPRRLLAMAASIFSAVSRAAAVSPWALVQVAILLNLSLAFFNLIPIPGLDGGRIVLALVGALRGRPLTFQQEQAINFAGFAFVMLLMAFVVVRDVSRFF